VLWVFFSALFLLNFLYVAGQERCRSWRGAGMVKFQDKLIVFGGMSGGGITLSESSSDDYAVVSFSLLTW
jgi:hypothetical protein